MNDHDDNYSQSSFNQRRNAAESVSNPFESAIRDAKDKAYREEENRRQQQQVADLRKKNPAEYKRQFEAGLISKEGTDYYTSATENTITTSEDQDYKEKKIVNSGQALLDSKHLPRSSEDYFDRISKKIDTKELLEIVQVFGYQD